MKKKLMCYIYIYYFKLIYLYYYIITFQEENDVDDIDDIDDNEEVGEDEETEDILEIKEGVQSGEDLLVKHFALNAFDALVVF